MIAKGRYFPRYWIKGGVSLLAKMRKGSVLKAKVTAAITTMTKTA